MKWISVNDGTPPMDEELIVLVSWYHYDEDETPTEWTVRRGEYLSDRLSEVDTYTWRKWNMPEERLKDEKLMARAITHWAYAPTFQDEDTLKKTDESMCLCKKLRKFLNRDK